MSVNLWWRWNDGMSGHVWLGERELEALRQEMILRGMSAFPFHKLVPKPDADWVITPQEIEAVFAGETEEAATVADEKLWREWIAFLAAARDKGGLLAR